MSHVPIFAHGKAEDVLIVGGGDCGIAEEVLKHKAVRRCTQVEIDASVIEFAKEHFPEFTRPVFKDKRFESVIADGLNIRRATTDTALRRHHRGLRPIRRDPARCCSRKAILCRRKRCLKQRRRAGDAERRAVLPARASSRPACRICHALFADADLLISPRSRPMSAGIWRWASPPTTRLLRAASRRKMLAGAIARPGGSRPDTGRRSCTAELRAAALHR